LFIPSARLGGDAFGYCMLDERTFAIYIVDVSGHGAGAAMYTVSLMNILRQRAVPATDLRDPGAVLGTLNAMFQMERHGGMFATMWYGVYDTSTRVLRFSSAGHHPAFMVAPDRREAVPLRTSSPIIGGRPDVTFEVEHTSVPNGASLYLFSDGVFEIVTAAGAQWQLRDFTQQILAPAAPSERETERLYRAVRSVARAGPLEDDFTLMVMTLA
jgi:serine phosphatase RsbU (regulator of sigma subunit)